MKSFELQMISSTVHVTSDVRPGQFVTKVSLAFLACGNRVAKVVGTR